MLTVRAKIAAGPEGFSASGTAAPKEAANLMFILFKPMLLAYPWVPGQPLGGTEAAARLLGV